MMPWLTSTLVSTTVLMLGVLAVRRPIAKAFGVRVAYALWLLPVLRMVLPPLPGHRALYVPVLHVDPAAPIRVGLAPPDLPGDALLLPPDLAHALAPAPEAAWSWGALLLALWLGGAALCFAWKMLRYRRFVARALDGATPLGTECTVEVLLSDHVEGPVASGLIRRRIFLPRDFVERYTSAERRQALLHEGAHHDRHDLLANLAGLAVLALHWWNPIAHLAHRAFRSDQELACDATVLARADAASRYAYGSALVKSACARTPTAACALDPTTEIKRRLRMIKRGGLPLPLRAAGALLATAAIGGGLVATASSGAAPPPIAAIEPIAAPVSAAPPVAAADPAIVPPIAPRPPHALHAPRAPRTPSPPLPPRAVSDAEQRARLAEIAAARAGEQARLAALRARAAGLEAAALSQASLAHARASLVARCAARGHPVRAEEQDWGQLALCDKAAFHAELRRSLTIARAQVDRDPSLSRVGVQAARAAIDRAIASVDSGER